MSAMQPGETSRAEDIKNLLISLFFLALAVAIYGAVTGNPVDTSSVRR